MKYTNLLLALFLFVSCTEDELPMPAPSICDAPSPTYDVEIRPIIEASCAYSGCHLDGSSSIYLSYEDVLFDVKNGTFYDRVVAQRDDAIFGMPPSYSPDDRPKDLSAEEVLIIECWLEAGAPQN